MMGLILIVLDIISIIMLTVQQRKENELSDKQLSRRADCQDHKSVPYK